MCSGDHHVLFFRHSARIHPCAPLSRLAMAGLAQRYCLLALNRLNTITLNQFATSLPTGSGASRTVQSRPAATPNAAGTSMPLQFESVLSRYPDPHRPKLGSWREANDTVTRIGGWRTSPCPKRPILVATRHHRVPSTTARPSAQRTHRPNPHAGHGRSHERRSNSSRTSQRRMCFRLQRVALAVGGAGLLLLAGCATVDVNKAIARADQDAGGFDRWQAHARSKPNKARSELRSTATTPRQTTKRRRCGSLGAGKQSDHAGAAGAKLELKRRTPRRRGVCRTRFSRAGASSHAERNRDRPHARVRFYWMY